MKKILLPTDFSNNAQKAIDYARQLFSGKRCVFYVLHAYQMAPTAKIGKKEAGEKLENLVSQLNKTAQGGHTFESIFLEELPQDAINVALIDNDADMVVMGTQGASALARIFLGSTAVKVLRHVKSCPVLTVPGQFEPTLPTNIIFPNDLKHFFRVEELYPLKYLVNHLNATLTILYFSISGEKLTNQQELNRELLKNNFKGINCQFKEVPLGISMATSINKVIDEHDEVGMVALWRSKHGFFETWLREPVIRNVVFTTRIPLLVLPNLE